MDNFAIGYNKLIAIIFQKYRDNGKPINLSEARKKADRVKGKIDFNNDNDIISAGSKA